MNQILIIALGVALSIGIIIALSSGAVLDTYMADLEEAGQTLILDDKIKQCLDMLNKDSCPSCLVNLIKEYDSVTDPLGKNPMDAEQAKIFKSIPQCGI